VSEQQFEDVSEITARWNSKPTQDGLVRVLGLDRPEGDTRATVAANPPNTGPTASNVDARIPKDLETLSVPKGGAEELKGQALDDALDERGLSKSGSAAEKRQRVADYDEDDDE
jgi:hypothetical protein